MNSCLLSSNKDDWETPDNLYNYLDSIFHFTLDPSCNIYNKKCEFFYTYVSCDNNGLVNSWFGHTVFCNPPYGKIIHEWIYKGFNEWIQNHVTSVFLIPARVDTQWFHRYVLHHADIIFLRGRIKFKGAQYPAPFPSMLVIFSDLANGSINHLTINNNMELKLYE